MNNCNYNNTNRLPTKITTITKNSKQQQQQTQTNAKERTIISQIFF